MAEVILFTAQTWPHCQTAKSYLREKGITFEERDVNTDEQARIELLNRGLTGVPVFLIGDETVIGLDKMKLDRLLAKKIISCEHCGSRLRVPRGKGPIRITCPRC